jgi:hypothetical protein
MAEAVKTQSYESHAHRPVLTVLAGLCAGPALVYFTRAWFDGWHGIAVAGVLLSLSVICLISISRVYTTALQNRIIRLEMRVRLMDLLPKDQHRQISQLTTPQMVGLRFASDPELPALVERAIAERLSRDDIKRAIKNWVPDWERT